MSAVVPLRVPVQSRSQRTRAVVLAAARRAFAEQGYAATTAKSIAALAQVGTGTFYHYFPDKDAALAEICSERVASLAAGAEAIGAEPVQVAGSIEAVVAAARDRLSKVVRLSLDYHRQEPGLHAVIEERRGIDPTIRSLMADSDARFQRRLAAGLAQWGFDGDAQATAFMMFTLLEGAVHSHVLARPQLDDARFVAALVESLFRLGLPAALVVPRSLPPGSPIPQEASHANRRRQG